MFRSLSRPLLFGLVIIGALVPWFISVQRLQRPGGPASPPTPPPAVAPTSSAPSKPAAMKDPATYAANRLKEIKANPEKWVEPWPWRQEFAAAATPELQREVLGLARQIGPEPLISLLALALASEDPAV